MSELITIHYPELPDHPGVPSGDPETFPPEQLAHRLARITADIQMASILINEGKLPALLVTDRYPSSAIREIKIILVPARGGDSEARYA